MGRSGGAKRSGNPTTGPPPFNSVFTHVCINRSVIALFGKVCEVDLMPPATVGKVESPIAFTIPNPRVCGNPSEMADRRRELPGVWAYNTSLIKKWETVL